MRLISTTQQDVDRSLEIAVYTALRDNGYIADREMYLDPVDYAQQMNLIRAAKKFAVELYGNGAPEDRENLAVPRIVITGQGFIPGSAGRDFGTRLEKNLDNANYTKYNQGTPLSHYRVRVELWSKSTTQDRLLEAIRQVALPNLSFIQKWDSNDPDDKYLIEYGFTASVPELQHGLTHKIYTYEIKDVAESNENIESINIVPIKEINVINDTDLTEIVKVQSNPAP